MSGRAAGEDTAAVAFVLDELMGWLVGLVAARASLAEWTREAGDDVGTDVN